eukprot:CAMPEP_0175705126 /NCGR_PEP_ID=MMETSP0097-20121207/37375_1 /TAXON_ID=311494 /ORGANISM="Alexandrium monilatum, Strain CCMP3105" /LENGTH=40 /DNA_ID= /DNA_START= /DNA_END= /DNA_ORIENTATION=
MTQTGRQGALVRRRPVAGANEDDADALRWPRGPHAEITSK